MRFKQLVSRHPLWLGVIVLSVSAISYSALSWDKPMDGNAGSPKAESVPKRDPLLAIQSVSLADATPVDTHMVLPLPSQEQAELTWDPRLQKAARAIFAKYTVPEASLVAIDPETGRILAYVSYMHGQANPPDLARVASAPAASVFKVITSAALFQQGVTPKSSACFHGGLHRLDASDIVNDEKRDTTCATLAEALGGSINAVFAKLAIKHLNPDKLKQTASAFGFGKTLPFDLPVEQSRIDVPGDELEFARTAAGFWHTTLSPLHGALLAAIVANDGVMSAPYMVERVSAATGQNLYTANPAAKKRIISQMHARWLGEMMERTVTHGTSRSAFYGPGRKAYLPNIRVAGKTGSLDNPNPYRAYSWWVGFAPIDHPRVAIAVLIVNGPKWIIKSSFAAKEFLRIFFQKPTQAPAPPSQG